VAADINIAYKEYISVGEEDAGALEKIIIDGEGIIRHFAALYGNGFDRDDLYQTGVMGLLRAARTFNPDCGTAFSTWAVSCVISEIRHYVRRERAYLRPEAEGGENGETDEPNNQSAQSSCFLPLEAADTHECEKPRSFHLAVEDKIMLEQAAAKLVGLQRTVIHSLFFREMTQQQAADELGITQRRVSRLKCAALKLLHELLDTESFHLVDPKYSFKNISPNAEHGAIKL